MSDSSPLPESHPVETSYCPVSRLQICEQDNSRHCLQPLGGVGYAVVITGARACAFRPRGGNNPCSCTRPPPTVENYLAQNVSRAKAEKLCLKKPRTGRSFVTRIIHNCKSGPNLLLFPFDALPVIFTFKYLPRLVST